MDDDRVGERLIILPGQEALLRRMLAPEEGLPRDFCFVGAAMRRDWVEALYTHHGRPVRLRLEHPAQSNRGGTDTEAFRIVPPEPCPPGLLDLVDALARSIRAREHEFRWQAPRGREPERDLDVEWLAFRAGIKPAIRISCEPSSADEIERRYRSGGAEVRRALRMIDGTQQAIVYVARTAARAEELRRVECGTTPRAWLRNRFAGHDRELGMLLGFPGCCVEAFQRRAHSKLDDWYRTACDAWMARPAPLLNVLLMPEGRSLLSFYPCRYDCAAALDLATKTAGVARKADAPWVDFVERQLALPIAVDSAGARAHVELDGRIPEGGARIVEAWAPVSPGGNSLQLDVELADRLRNRPVSRQGLVQDLPGARPPIVMDFSAGR